MMEEILATTQLEAQKALIAAPQATYRREWETSSKIERLENEISVERARLGEVDAKDYWNTVLV